MPNAYSSEFKRKINATSSDEAPLLLLEISHADLAQPARVVNDNQDITSNGDNYIEIAFKASLPDQREKQMPRAQLQIDAVPELLEVLEATNGGESATVRMMQVLRSNPDLIEWEATLDLMNVQIANGIVQGELGFQDILNQPGVPMTFRPSTTPGLY